MTPQNSIYTVWGAALKQWEVLKKLSTSEQEEIRSFVVFWSGYSALYVTSRDVVCGIGNNGACLNLLGLTGQEYGIESAEKPVEVKSLSNKGISSICLGVFVGAALDRDGWLYWWGCCSENYGEIRTPHLASDLPRYTEISCGAMFIAALTSEGGVYVWGRFWNTDNFFTELPLLTSSVVNISCGVGHLAMVTRDGCVYTWGDGRNGQRGYAPYRYQEHDEVVKRVEIYQPCSLVKSGGHGTLFLTNSGEVWACGANEARYGYLGVDSRQKEIVQPARVFLSEKAIELVSAWNSTLVTTYAALTETGNVYTWGKTELPQFVPSVGTSLVGSFLGLSTPRDTMVQVRPPSLVPPLSSSQTTVPSDPEAEQTKRTWHANNKYLDVIMNQFFFRTS